MRDYRKMLVDLRSEIISAFHTLPYTVYTDETLELLLVAKPKTIEELAEIKGFPAEGKRIKGFGEAIVAIFDDSKEIKSITVKDSEEGEEEEIITELEMNVF